eukprot:XP_011423192.1 PREDICTED: uncharacterized protein LOC105325365 [Crassostrea gigas]
MEDQQPALIRSSSLDPKFLQRPPSHRSITRSRIVPSSISFVDQQPLTEEPEPNDKDPERHCDSKKKDPEKHQVRCIECVKAIPVFSCHDIEAGDHVVFSGAVYDHHGIIISKLNDDETFEIIEATNTISGAVLGVSKFFGGKAEIKCSFKKFDFDGEKICVVVYRHRYSKEETVRRATGFYNRKEDSKKYKYDLFYNNCEHFATYCVTGQNFSVQVSKFRLTWKLFWSSGFVGVSDELERNKKEFENGIICDDCYEMNKKLLGVGVKPIVSERDVQKGDIIRYSYWNLWHDAVVLEVSNTNKNSVVCSIAHYAFCGPFSHRTIKEEMKEIPFNGQSLKLDYAPPQYNVYEPDKVVKRARKRLGEQLFVFFSNDSSHFARWCKLKLRRS